MTEIDVVADWGIIEADFMREYGIDLPLCIDKITWRQFLVFLYNLSEQSLMVTISRARQNGELPIEADKMTSDRILQQYFG